MPPSLGEIKIKIEPEAQEWLDRFEAAVKVLENDSALRAELDAARELLSLASTLLHSGDEWEVWHLAADGWDEMYKKHLAQHDALKGGEK